MNFDIKKILSDFSIKSNGTLPNNIEREENVSLFDGQNDNDSAGRISSLQSERAGLVTALSNTDDENEARELQNKIDRIDDEIYQQKLHEHYENFVSESSLPQNISRQLFDLTVQSVETDDLAGRAAREQQINAIKSQYNLSESDLEHLDLARSIAKDYKLTQIEKEQARSNFAANDKVDKLEQQLSRATDSSVRNRINNEISQVKEEQFKNNLAAEKNKFITSTNLPLDVAYQLFDLYAQKGEITDADQLNKINQKLEQISQMYELNQSDTEFLARAENMSKEHKLNRMEERHDRLSDANLIKLEDLFNEIANATDPDEISRLYAEIDALGSEQFKATTEFEKERFLTTTDLPKDAAAKLFDLTMDITMSDDENEIQTLKAELNALTQQYSLSESDKKTLDEVTNLSKQYKLDVAMSVYVQAYRTNVDAFQQLNNDLENTTDPNDRERIQNDIKSVTNKMRSDTLNFEMEKLLLDTELPKDVVRDLFQLTIDKTQTTDELQLANINAQIEAISKQYNISEADLAHLSDAEEVAAAE